MQGILHDIPVTDANRDELTALFKHYHLAVKFEKLTRVWISVPAVEVRLNFDLRQDGLVRSFSIATGIGIVCRPMACCGAVETSGWYGTDPISITRMSLIIQLLPGVFSNYGVILAITNPGEKPAADLFEKHGWKPTHFYNPNSGNNCILWSFTDDRNKPAPKVEEPKREPTIQNIPKEARPAKASPRPAARATLAQVVRPGIRRASALIQRRVGR